MAAIDGIETQIDEEMFTEELDALTTVIDALHTLTPGMQTRIITSAEVFLGLGQITFDKTHDEFGDDIPGRATPTGPPYPPNKDPQ